MSNQTKRLLLSVSNAFYTLVDKNGEWNERGTKIVGSITLVLIIFAFWFEGSNL